jgi:2-polyprenyl-3-methyl-5-hydroxy-6-metoxy-1,4-benzoquinol methylase
MYYGRVSIVTSFDVIEHVENPIRFIEDIYQLLEKGGKAIIGTPTDAPVMRELLGDIYEQQQLFSTQHLWVLGEKNLKLIADKVGFENVNVKYFQRYGINNLLGWLREKKTRSDINSGYISRTLDETWKAEISDKGLSDYIVLYLEK